jgi:hypothetical protein
VTWAKSTVAAVSGLPGDSTAPGLEDVQRLGRRRRHAERAVQDQPGHQLRVPDGADHRDQAAAGRADQDRPGDAEGPAQSGDVVRPPIPGPGSRLTDVRPARAALIQVHDLRDVGEGGELRFEQGVVSTGTAVQQDQRRPLGHRLAVDGQRLAVHIEEQRDVVDGDPHVVSSPISARPDVVPVGSRQHQPYFVRQ